MSKASDLALRWNDPDDVADAASFAGQVIGAEAAYISHGEIQCGLSDDGTSWVPDLAERYSEDFADPRGRDMLVARDQSGAVVAMLVVAYEASSRREFAVIEDMAVAPEMRSHGIGARLVDEALERIETRGIEWAFLESGRDNEEAHAFFEREGFTRLSSVFGKRLSGQ